MFPLFDTFQIARNETELEDAFERLMDRADNMFMHGTHSQLEYDAWCKAAENAFDLALFNLQKLKGDKFFAVILADLD